MAKVTVVKEKNYTTIDNGIFKDTRISFKAKGLLTTMLSLPPTWNYTIEGLATLSKDGRDSIKTALKELENFGYLERKQVRNDNGSFCDLEYFVYEKPQPKEPLAENPPTDKSLAENHEQLNTNISSTDKSNTDEVNTKGLNTEKEDKTLSNDNVEVKTSFSENRKKMSPHKTNLQKYLDKKKDEHNMLERLAEICASNYDEGPALEIFKTIKYYFERYTEKTGLIHPILTDKTLNRITEKMDCFYDSEYSHFERLIGQDHAFMKMVDMFFDGDFGANNGNETNYNLPAFMTDGVLNPLGQRLFELGEVE